MQTAMTFLIVFLAAIYACWKFLPMRVRAAWANKGADWLRKTGRISSENARRLESKLASGGACGSCDSCKACATPNLSLPTAPKQNRDAIKVIPIYKTE